MVAIMYFLTQLSSLPLWNWYTKQHLWFSWYLNLLQLPFINITKLFAVFCTITRVKMASHHPRTLPKKTSYSPLFSGTGLRCCWSAGQGHCGSPPECGRHTHSSSVRTGAGAGSWLLMWSAWSLRQGCRSGLRVESEGSPAELEKKDSWTFSL